MEFLSKYKLNNLNEEMINTALTHSSYTNEHGGIDYERLEYLGDAVLQLIISEYYYLNANLDEGEMSKQRASYVCEDALVEYAKHLDLKDQIKTGEGQKNNIGSAIIADVFEALIGAIYLSAGIGQAKKFVYQVIIPYIEKQYHFFEDYKSVLQEMVQTSKNSLEYVVVDERGPAHSRTFTVEVKIDNIIYGVGQGKTKKDAEQQAALAAYQKRAKNGD